jgi:hypothetical protein
MSCTDRIAKVIDEKKGDEKRFTLKELARRWKQ